MKEVCPPTCLQSSAAAVGRPPPPWTDRRLEAVLSPPDSLLGHPQPPQSPHHHQQPSALRAQRRNGTMAMLGFSDSVLLGSLFNVKKKNQAASQIRCLEKNDPHPFLPPEPYGETWLRRHRHEFLGRCSEKSSVRLPLPVCPPLQTQLWSRVLGRMLWDTFCRAMACFPNS